MRRRLFLAAFALAHVLALFGPLVWVPVFNPQSPPPAAPWIILPTDPVDQHIVVQYADPLPPDPRFARASAERINERKSLRHTRLQLAIGREWSTQPQLFLDPTKSYTPEEAEAELRSRSEWISAVAHDKLALEDRARWMAAVRRGLLIADSNSIQQVEADIARLQQEIASLQAKGS
jgi:hypothetical protein